MDSPLLDRATIVAAFTRLGERLVRRGICAEVYVFGGAAVALAYDAQRVTRDIDAVFSSHGPLIEESRVVARELGLPDWWLNEQASAYVAPGGDPQAARVFEHPGLRVSAASPEHLLAMKIHAARRRDAPDIALIAKHLGIDSAAAALEVAALVFPDDPVPPRAVPMLEELFGTRHVD